LTPRADDDSRMAYESGVGGDVQRK
jgi:hypothetical protein